MLKNLKGDKKSNNIKFGCYIYQDGLKYKDILRIILECEKLGYDSVWLKDNFIPWIQDYISFNSNNNNKNNSSEHHRQEKYQEQNQKQHYKEEPSERMMLECWTTLSSLASVTTKIRLGAILVNLYRNPSVVAKMASTLDFISNGRLDIGLSAGWYQREAQAYGIAFPASSVRIEMLEESVIILRQMLSAENENNNGKISFDGRYYNISNTECNPKPIQKPHIPIWIGGSGKKTLKVVAKYADGWNYGLCSYDEYAEKLSVLKNYCHNNKVSGSRSYDDIIKAWHGILFLGIDETELRSRNMNISYKKGIVKDSKLVIAGTPKTILREIKRYLNIGVTYFTVCFPDLPDTRSLQLFAEHIIRHFRNR
jgi:alkanesulfonate monooxygenase SsuD/methylene tetrahydromethanopterin reductase-like flavin-dependent oxidoreductase (luciferase family)